MSKLAEADILERACSVETLNANCFCVSLEPDRLRAALERALGSPEVYALVQERLPSMFAARPVFVSPAHLQRMAELVSAVESLAMLPSYVEHVLARAPAVARHDPGARGAFFGYDFHDSADRTGLIEINTNAGGAMLNAMLARAHLACCTPVEWLGPNERMAERFEEAMVEMFFDEWRLAGRGGRPRCIAIVDEAPASQFLYPEFLLFRRLFERHGLQVVIADPSELRFAGGVLRHGDTAVDLVYNRLTDFYFESAGSAALREAYLANAAVVTPHPRAHAIFADKRNLALMTDSKALADLGVPGALRAILLDGIPETRIVDAENAPRLRAERRDWFFKPFAGYGGKAAYRGDKVTQRVWDEIAAGGYVAQRLVAPGERTMSDNGERPLKYDLRNFAYVGRVQWVAARLYQGQTTNFRTPGGGFAPVYRSPF